MTTDGAKGEAPKSEGLAARIPAEVSAALNESQLAALEAAVGPPRPWRRQPIDIRLTFPIGGGRRAFLTLVGGTDKRNPTRRAQDREEHPIRTKTNLVFLGAAVVALYAVAGVIALLVAAAIRSG